MLIKLKLKIVWGNFLIMKINMGDYSVNIIFQLQDGTFAECMKNTWHEYVDLMREKKQKCALKLIETYSIAHDNDWARRFWSCHERADFNMLVYLNDYRSTINEE